LILIQNTVLNFVTELDRLIEVHGLDVMDAVLHVCSEHNIEVETAASIIASNPKLKGLLQMEAEKLNFLKGPKKASLEFAFEE